MTLWNKPRGCVARSKPKTKRYIRRNMEWTKVPPKRETGKRIDGDKIVKAVLAHPDKRMDEIARMFGVSRQLVGYYCRKRGLVFARNSIGGRRQRN